jgi:hypothetical protein
MPDAMTGSSLIATNAGQFVYSTSAPGIAKHAFGIGGSIWGANAMGQPIFGLALGGNNSVLSSGGSSFNQGGVFDAAFDSDGSLTLSPMSGTENGRVYQLVASANGQLFFGRETTSTSGILARYDLSTRRTVSFSSGVKAFRSAAVLGSDDRMYTVDVNGEVTSWAASGLSALWSFSALARDVEASPSLDCSRQADGTPTGGSFPGVLYVAAGTTLHAFIVDSPRMPKEQGGWPKYQHDARNSGNPATPITNCP